MSLSFNSSTFRLVKDGRVVFDPSLLPCALVHAAKITVSGQTIDFPDPVHDNAYYWLGAGTSPVKEEYGAYITLVPEEHSFTDILLGTVPTGTDYLDVKVTFSRTTNPSHVFGDTVPTVTAQSKETRLLGGSCLLEETAAFSRGFDIVLSGTNVYLRRYQSVGKSSLLTGAFQGWSASNSASDSGRFTWATSQGPLVALIGYVPLNTYAGGAYTHQRGQGNAIPLTDSTNFHSVYSADFEITPGFFNTSATLTAPASKSAIRLGAISSLFAAASSASFASFPFGTPASSRRILVALTSRGDSGAITTTAMTIGGVSATKLVESSDASGNLASIWMASVPTGNSGTIAVTYSAAHARSVSAAVYALYNLSSGTPHNTQNTTTSASALTLTTVSGGFAFAAEMHVNSGQDASRSLAGLTMTGYEEMNPITSTSITNHGVGFQPTTGSSLSISFTSSFSGALACASLS